MFAQNFGLKEVTRFDISLPYLKVGIVWSQVPMWTQNLRNETERIFNDTNLRACGDLACRYLRSSLRPEPGLVGRIGPNLAITYRNACPVTTIREETRIPERSHPEIPSQSWTSLGRESLRTSGSHSRPTKRTT